jgi:hypothetical protein
MCVDCFKLERQYERYWYTRRKRMQARYGRWFAGERAA